MVLHPQGIKGPWKAGIVLDWHTVASQVIGQNEFGYPIFDNKRSEIGELLYQFKYRNDQNALQQIVRASIEYLGDKVKGRIELILPVPPSNPVRTVTSQIAQGLANGLHIGFSSNALAKSKNTSELKSVTDPEERRKILEGAFRVDKQQLEGRSVLLVDDVYRSGATLITATEAVTGQGNAKTVYVLAITRTRVHR
ncbi:MAG: ComF family protein [Gammaproteobacteria bacterium]|nr:ComF family protein [Gammaproteobacteria bacterium]